MKSISIDVSDGQHVKLPNSIVDIGFSVKSMARGKQIYVHCVYEEDDRYGETEYEVRIAKLWHNNRLDKFENVEWSQIIGTGSREFVYVQLCEVNG